MDETAEQILAATERAICETGYADLTVQDIAEESSLTTAAVHYHFDTKADLLAAFLEWSIERFERRLAGDEADPAVRLATFLETAFAPSDEGDFAVAMMELKAQAPYEERFRDRFRRFDDLLEAFVPDAVREGVESGQFEASDPETVARLVVTLVEGGHARGVALGEDSAATRAVDLCRAGGRSDARGDARVTPAQRSTGRRSAVQSESAVEE